MGVYISGMEMPENCGECFARKAELSQEKKVIYICCFVRKEYCFDGKRMDDCPPYRRPAAWGFDRSKGCLQFHFEWDGNDGISVKSVRLYSRI